MVSPDPGKGMNTGGAAPPGVYDPYKTLITDLKLSQEVFALLNPTFDLKGFPLQLDDKDLTDFVKTPLPHYQVQTGAGKVFLIHLAESVASDTYAQNWFLMLAYSFLNAKPCAFFVFSEVDSFAFDTEKMIDTWQSERPSLKVRFVSLPVIQQLRIEPSNEKRNEIVRGLLYLDDLLVADQGSLDAQIDNAYKQVRLDLLDNLKGLPERLNDTDKSYIINFLANLAFTTPPNEPKKYLIALIGKLGLDIKEAGIILPILSGNPSNDSESLLLWLEEKTYPNGTVQGYKRVLGYLLSLLADEGGGKKITLIMFKYRLIPSAAILQTLVTKYP